MRSSPTGLSFDLRGAMSRLTPPTAILRAQRSHPAYRQGRSSCQGDFALHLLSGAGMFHRSSVLPGRQAPLRGIRLYALLAPK